MDRFQKRPMDFVLLYVGAPWLAVNVARGVYRALPSSSSPDDDDAIVQQEVNFKGKRFQQVVDKQHGEVDLGLSAVVPYLIPVGLVGMDAVLLFLRGAQHEGRRGARIAAWFRLYLFFAVFPLVDLISGEDWQNPSKLQEQQQRGKQRVHFRAPLYLWCLFELIMTLGAFREMLAPGTGGLPRGLRIALFFKLAMLNGALGINVSHELLHKRKSWVERQLAYGLLVNVNYCHWQNEHEHGHHEHVATPRDAATSKQGQSLYSFLPQTFLGTWRSACELESQRLRLASSSSSWYCKENKVLQGVLASFAWSLVLARYSRSWLAVPLFYAQGTVSALMLEVINYIEHYGLERKQAGGGGEDGSEEATYEPVDPTHSWNAPHSFSNTLLFKLQRHSDHHTFPTRPYELLRNFAESPQMPCGYVGMLVLAFCPPAFFYIMEPLLQAHKLRGNSQGEKEKEEEEIERLTQQSRRRIWAWTVGLFSAGTAAISVLVAGEKRRRRRRM